jgi:myxalamid-type polyketide synthase MxaE and MxaD
VSLDLTSERTEVQTLFDELWSEEREDQVAFRGKERFVLRLVPHPKVVTSLPEVEVPTSVDTCGAVRSDGTYLITGGLGGLGLKVAQWLIDQGARHLVLMGRRGASESANEALACMRAAGAHVVVAQADVAREEQVGRVFADIAQSMPPLRGVIHAAGVLDDGVLLKLDRDRFTSVMAPKVAGAWNLHTLSIEQPLEFFVLFSSVASLLGSPGQGNYAAANAFLDALAHHRHVRGLPALSINWGPWAEVGMAARLDGRGRLAGRGTASIGPEKGVEVLGRLLGKGAAQIGVMPVNLLRQWTQLHPRAAESPLLRDLVRGEREIPLPRPKRNASLTYDRLLAAAAEERQQLLEPYLRTQVAEALGMSASTLDAQQPLSDLGLNSLMAVELQTQVKSDLGVSISMADLSQNPSVGDIAAQLLARLFPAAHTPRASLLSSDEWEEFGL